jgi:hypothetical protein
VWHGNTRFSRRRARDPTFGAPFELTDDDSCQNGQRADRCATLEHRMTLAAEPMARVGSTVGTLAQLLHGWRIVVLTGAGVSTESGIPDLSAAETRCRAASRPCALCAPHRVLRRTGRSTWLASIPTSINKLAGAWFFYWTDGADVVRGL